MTVREDTAARLTAQNSAISSIMTEKDARTLELATAVDQNTETIKIMTEEYDKLDRAYNAHMALPHYAPPEPEYQTLFGLGGGNLPRTGVDADRRYYGPTGVAKTITDTTANETKGILSWNSHKTPYGWADMVRGAGDDWFKDLMKRLSEAIKPMIDDPDDVDEVYESIHHEPEGDGAEKLWRDMQARLSEMVPGGPDGPIKFWLTTTGWGQEFNTQRVAQETDWETSLYPSGAPIYGIAYDAPYQTYGAVWDKATQTKTSLFEEKWLDPYVYVDAIARRAASYGVEAGIGEWGYSDEAFLKDKSWGGKVMDRCINNPIQRLRIATYFDTPLNSIRSWHLGAAGSTKRNHHMQLIANRRAA